MKSDNHKNSSEIKISKIYNAHDENRKYVKTTVEFF